LGKIFIGRGIKFLLHERSFEIVEEVRENVFLAKDLHFNAQREFSLDQLLDHWSNAELSFEEKGKNTTDDEVQKYAITAFEKLPKEMKDEAIFRFKAIKPLIGLDVPSFSPYVEQREKELRAKGEKVSRASLYRWLKAFNEGNSDLRSLVSSFHKCGAKERRIDGEPDIIIESVIDELIAKGENISVETVYEIVYHQIDKKNEQRKESLIKHPSKSTVWRRVKEREKYDVDEAKYGREYAIKNNKQFNIQNKPQYPLQRVECDHTRLDLFVVDDKNRLPIGRPWVTVLFDVATGYPLGYYIGFEPPSYTSVMHVLRHSIMPKSYIKNKYPRIKNEWLAYGVPDVLVMDNGKEFHSKHLDEVCLLLQMEKDYNPPRKPWYKGAVERHFRTLNQQLIHSTPGTTFSNIFDRKDYDPQKNAIIGFKRLIEYLHKWLVDYYAMKYSKGVRGIPAKLWELGIQKRGRPPLPAVKVDWEIILLKIGKASIQHTGVRMKHLFYNSPVLSKIRGYFTRNRIKNRVDIKFDPTDLSKIHIYDPIYKKDYIQVFCINQEYSQELNEYTHRVIVKKLNQASKEVDMSALAATKAELMKIIDEELNLTLREKQMANRIKGIGSNQVIAEDEDHKEEDSHMSEEGKDEDPLVETAKEELEEDLELFDLEDEWGTFDVGS
jgi:putative transposase